MCERTTIHVAHMGGTDVGIQSAASLDSSKQTLVMVNSFLTNSNLFKPQYANKRLTDAMNVIGIEPLGHGLTSTNGEHWTFWDTAIMNLQVLAELEKRGDIKGKVFVSGTSQGGWITTRMALLAPEKIAGIIPLGSCMDYESPTTRQLGGWDANKEMTPMIDDFTTSTVTNDFVMPDETLNFLIEIGFGKGVSQQERDFWQNEIKSMYHGDAGRRRARMAAINLRDRDGLHARLFDVKCPVLWLHGTADPVCSIANAEREIKMFVNSPDARLEIVEGGVHYLNYSHPKEVDAALVKFVEKHGKA